MKIEPQFEGDLEVGKFYLVPTVKGTLSFWTEIFPVLGPLHEDKEIIGFEPHHYHIDFRFLDETIFDWAQRYGPPHRWVLYHDIGPVVFRRRKCRRPMPDFPISPFAFPALIKAYKDHRLLDGLICPHRGASLRGLPVDGEGCVICPLHGLRWNVTTGQLQPIQVRQ